MKKSYITPTYELTIFTYPSSFVLTLSSDRENAYIPSDTLWEDFEFDDDD